MFILEERRYRVNGDLLEADKIVLRHEARGRQGFARGAILATEWIPGKTGVFTFDDVLFGRSTDA